jgi:hypothetical protein
MFSNARLHVRRVGATTAAGLTLALLATGVAGAAASATGAKIPAKTAKFCATWATVDQKASVADTETPEGVKAFATDIQPTVDALVQSAPADVSGALGKLQAGVTAAVGGDANAFNSDDFNAADAQIEVYVHDSCGFEKVDVTAVDYAYQGIPKKIKAGPASFELTNKTALNEFHVMVIVKEKKGVHLSPKALLTSGSEADVMKKATIVAATAAPPGQVAGVVAKLTPGTYVVFCPATVGGADNAEPHFMKGMVTGFTVK